MWNSIVSVPDHCLFIYFTTVPPREIKFSLGPLHYIFGPRQANLVLIAYASSEGLGEPAHSRSLARTQNLHCSLMQAVSQEEPSDRKPDPWPL